MFTIPVRLRDYPHQILIGADCLGQVGVQIKKLGIGSSAFIITNTTIAALYQKPLLKSLAKAGIRDWAIFRLRDGEKYKNQLEWQKALAMLAAFDNGENKKVFIINMGGGVVCDLGGFVTATYHRGIAYVQIPTTLLACVDSGVGGKVGVNLGKYKNSVGAIWQPRLVFADLALLKTLKLRQIKSGLAEVIKYGISMDPALLAFVNGHSREILACEKAALLQICRKSYQHKVAIVEQDVRDKKDIRIVLNYGHTIGHAVESASRYAYTHGEAVAIGMACANDIAVALGRLKKSTADACEAIIQKAGLPTRIKNCRLQDILESMKNDKKFIHNANRFVLISAIGRTKIVENIPHALIKKVVTRRMLHA
jgi:3-dehydroquinate synthase